MDAIRTALVGRQAELARIDAFVAAATGGARSLVLVGEAGIGKSALWRVGIERARAAGHVVLPARPAEEELSFPLVAVVDMFEAVGADLAPLLAGESHAAHGRAFLGVLRSLAREGPVLVAIDDAHWLDPASARAIRFAIRRLEDEPVVFLATVRPGVGSEPVADLLAAVRPERREEVIVRPLPARELRRVLRAVSPTVPAPVLRAIHEASGGNPLHAIELMRAHAGGAPGAAPGTLAAAIGARLDRSTPAVRSVLEVAAASGRPTQALIAAAAPDGAAALDAAVREGIVVVDRDGRVRFDHPLVQSVVYERIPPDRRRALHGRLADVVEDGDERVRHLALSAVGPAPAIASEVAAASERMAARGAFDLAGELAGHAGRLAATPDTDAVLAYGLAEIRALAKAGEWTRSLAAADALVARLPSGPARAEAIMERAFVEDDDFATGERWLEQAVAEAGDDDALQARILDWLGWARGMHRGALDDGIAVATLAVAAARRAGVEDITLPAVRTLEHMRVVAGRETPAALRRLLVEEMALDGVPLDDGPYARLAELRYLDGDLPGAAEALAQAQEQEERQHDENARAYRLYDAAMLDIAAGRLARAEENVHEGIEAARDARDTWGEALLQHSLALTLVWLGRAEEARTVARARLARAEARAERPWIARLTHVLGLLALSLGDAPAGYAALASADDLVTTMGFAHPAVFRTTPDAIEAAALAGAIDEAKGRLARLEAQALVAQSRWVDAISVVSRGIVVAAAGEAADAVPMLDRAATTLDELGFHTDAARARLAHGRAALSAGRRLDGAAALEAAREAFVAHGAAGFAGQVTEVLARMSRGRSSGDLTEAETQVARLAIAGRRNREIAGELYMSLSTVEGHLTRVYRKLGVRSRTELVRLDQLAAVAGDTPTG